MSAKKISKKDVDCLVVGGGPSGIFALQILQETQPSLESIGLLESAPSLGGRAKSALHLIDSDLSSPYPLLTGSLLGPPCVRWERQWIPISDVDWNSKEWVANLPQWQLLGQGLKTLLAEVSVPSFEDRIFVEVQSPVSRLSPLENGHWEVTTPDTVYQAGRVVWTAGLKPFQNALGKHEAQPYLVANPEYSSIAADFRGGVGLELEVPSDVQWEEGFRLDAIFGLPVRFESKFHLMIGVVHEEGERLILKTLTHAHQDLLSDPKNVSGFQKALRRGIKTLIQGDLPEGLAERWVVSDRVLGHRLGTPWLLGNASPGQSLVFVGDESNASASLDTLGALDSVVKVLGEA